MLVFVSITGSVMTTMPPKACPLPYEIADIVLGHCAEEVLTAIAQGGGDPCQYDNSHSRLTLLHSERQNWMQLWSF